LATAQSAMSPKLRVACNYGCRRHDRRVPMIVGKVALAREENSDPLRFVWVT